MRGVVKKWVADRGFGFIKSESGDVFVHYRALQGMDELAAGMQVEFDKVPGRDAGKWQAANVRLAGEAPARVQQIIPQQVSEAELRAEIARLFSDISTTAMDDLCGLASSHGWLSD